MTSEIANNNINDYITVDNVVNNVIPKFTVKNMLNLSVPWTGTTDTFLIVESHNNIHEYGHTSKASYP